jgi:hypothetical protein
MKQIIGIILIVIGGLSLAYKGFTYKSTEKLVDIGPLHATVETDKEIPTLYGALVLGLGVIILVVPMRGK